MKKITVLLLMSAMVLSLAACGGSDSGNTQATDTDATTTDSAEKEEAPAEETETETETDTTEAVMGVSNDYYSIVVDNVTWDDTTVTLELTYTNNDELPATFEFDAVDINGCRWYGGAYETVEAGASVSTTAELRQDSNSIFDSVDAYAFTQPDEITIYPEVVNEESDYDKSLTESFTFYPTGLTADEVTYPEYTPKDTDIVIIDQADLKVIITSVNPGSFQDVYYLYIQNDTDTRIKCSTDNETYQENGEVLDWSFGWEEAYPGERVSSIIYMKGDDVQSLAGTFVVTDYEDVWGDNPLATGDFAITVADYDDGE